MAQRVLMTKEELYKAEFLAKLKDKQLKQYQAAEKLEVSVRQVQRLYQLFLEGGAAALASKQRGKISNNKMPKKLRSTVAEIVTTKVYEDFGPTLMCEKIEERHSIKISKETTRKIMIECGVWWSCKENAHRALNKAGLTKVVCERDERIISKNLEFQFESVIYQIELEKPSKKLIKGLCCTIHHRASEISEKV